ncbi:MAG: TIGR03618 family F420-dependent PPOX class oxidoreductase [Anaerolineales bacterium]|jgi:hypothetical protein
MARMNTDEMWQLLAEPWRDAVITTVRPDGRPHGAPVWYTVEDEALIFSTWTESVKAHNLQHSPAVAVVVSQPRDPIFFILMEGLAFFIDVPDDEKHRLLGKIYTRYGETYNGKADLNETALVRVQISSMIGENYG